jgi:predicted MFS family arabinose efflux permease
MTVRGFSAVSAVNSKSSKSNYKWYVLTLTALTFTFVNALPQICMTVLFKEISDDLGLHLIEVGVVWGIIPLAALFTVFLGGLLADRYGAKRTISIACLVAGLAGAMRGLSVDFTTLALSNFFFGLAIWIIPSSVFKNTATWFSGRKLVVANGIATSGMALGFTIGSIISATIMSPLLGGWRNVVFLYGALSIIIGLVWLITVREPEQNKPASLEGRVPLRQTIGRILPIKAIWLIGLTMFGFSGGMQGMIGYLPTYLRESGWTVAAADGTLATFTSCGAIGSILLALLSDRLGLRKAVLFPALLIAIVGIALLPVVDNSVVWILMIVMGLTRDGCVAICLTISTETEGIGPVYAGTALGLTLTLAQIGAAISPPLGNSLASINPGFPFFLWAAFELLALVTFCFVKETGWRRR